MISVNRARRRAEEFAAQVDGEASADVPGQRAEMLELVAALRAVPEAEPRPEFVSSLREQLMAEADTALEATQKLTLPPTSRRRDRRIAVAAGVVAIVGASSSVAVASQGALPGDALYPIKRVIEGAEIAVTFDDQARTEQMLEAADERLAEVEKLARRNDAESADLLPSALRDFTAQTDDASQRIFDEYGGSEDDPQLQELREFASSSLNRLGDLDTLLPPGAVGPLGDAVDVLTGIDSRVSELCPDCSGGITQLPARLLNALGQVPDPTTALAPVVLEPALPTPDQTPPAEKANQKQKDAATDGGTGGKKATRDQTDNTDNPVDPLVEEGKKRGEKLKKTLEEGGKALEKTVDGVTEPLDPVLDPLLDPLLGDRGLLGKNGPLSPGSAED